MTGREAGYCAGYSEPGYANPGPRFGRRFRRFGRRGGLGWGRGGGWCHRNWHDATGVPGWARFGYAPAWGAPPPVWQAPHAPQPNYPRHQKARFLMQQVAWLQEQLQSIQERIAELEKATGEDKARQDG